MNILNRKICSSLAQKLTFTPAYQAYIHLQDHDQKINPKSTRLYLSFMDPKVRTEDVPSNPAFSAKLRKSAELELRKRLFEQYKQKILQGKVDDEQVVEVDQLWGDRQVPVHYYRYLSATQVSTLSSSILKDVEHYHHELTKDYIESSIKTTNIADVKQINQYAEVAAYYRFNNILDREKYYQIQQLIGTKFHLLTDKSLILLKYAFNATPKKSTPQFNHILNGLLLESLPKLSNTDLVHLLYFNRYDNFRMHKGNLQISVLETVAKRFKEFNLEQKIDFLFLYVESRSPTIRKHSHNRYHNEIRNRTQEIIYHLGIDGDFSTLSELSILKLAYSLIRAKTNVTQHLTLSICEYIQAHIDQISAQNLVLFFIYLNKIEAGKSIANHDLMKNLKQKVVANWESYSTLNKIRAIDAMYNLNLYDEAAHQLYTGIPIQADNIILAHFCRIQMMNSSGREWEVIHKLVQLDYLPFLHFQDYKRFYNYVSATAPDWKLDPLFDKLENTEIFFDALRLDSVSRDKKTYRGIRQFEEFSGLKALPKPFKICTAVKNVEFAEFSLPQYQICVDIVTDVQKIKGTRDLKGSYQIKIKNLECIGWKQLYVFQEDIQKLSPLQFFDYIYSICEPHFEQQLKVIATYEQYRSYQIEQLKLTQTVSWLKMREREQYDVVKDFELVEDELELKNKEIKTQDGKNIEQELKEKMGMGMGGGIGGPGG